MATKGNIILFGKTGEGKSTVANALTTGEVDNVLFPVSNGLLGCTTAMKRGSGRGWTITDTVGLGEASTGNVESREAEAIILRFLQRVRDRYSHIVYVKSATNRFDMMDEQIWKTFAHVFRGAESAFVVLFTKGTDEWLNDNFDDLPHWIRGVGRNNIFVTNLPPKSNRSKREEKNIQVRQESLSKLERNLAQSFQLRNGQYATPHIDTMNNEQLETESRSTLQYIMHILQNYVDPAISVARELARLLGLMRGVQGA